MCEISIILPVYNQADHVEQVIDQYLTALSGLRYEFELILVVNGNRDGSLSCCQRMSAKEPTRIRTIISQPGWGKAVRTGLAEAKGETLCFTNLARTPPEILVAHIVVAMANPDYVIKANRKVRQSLIRKIGTVLYNFECRFLFELPTWDVNGTPKVFGRKLPFLSRLREDGDLLDVEFIVRCRNEGITILEMPIVASTRHGGESTTNYRSAIRMYLGAARLSRSMNRNRTRPRG